MDQTITHRNIPAYIYNESSPIETLMLEAEMLHDEVLREEVECALLVKKELDSYTASPSDATIDAILRYSVSLTDQIAALN